LDLNPNQILFFILFILFIPVNKRILFFLFGSGFAGLGIHLEGTMALH